MNMEKMDKNRKEQFKGRNKREINYDDVMEEKIYKMKKLKQKNNKLHKKILLLLNI